MTESRPGDDIAKDLEREADKLEQHLDQLGDHISDAKKTAAARREEAIPDAIGDYEETRGAPGQGQDPEGAIGEHGDSPGATEADATTDDAPQASGGGDDAKAGSPAAGSERTDPVGSRMPGHPSGGDD
jgi:hypothetical protein